MTATAKPTTTADKLARYRARLKECMAMANQAYKDDKMRVLQSALRMAEMAAYKVAEKKGEP